MAERLVDEYDAVLVDLDGTVYRGDHEIPGVADTLRAVRALAVHVRFVTNNASRAPGAVAEQLVGLRISAEVAEVCTSAQAAAAMLADRLPPGAIVLVAGAPALADEINRVGLRVVAEASGQVDAVVQGLSRDIGWRELSEACLAVRAGALWVACNVDATLPTERGEVIGNGALVAAVRVATGAEPLVAGKPNRPLLDQAARSAGARRPLVVGDRLDTDIAGAATAEMDSLLVLTGVSTPAELLGTTVPRPTFLAPDLGALTAPAAQARVGPQPDWEITADDGALRARWRGARDPDPIALLRALVAVHPPNGTSPILKAEDGTSADALAELKLTDRLA
ncbi:MAG: HAD-IIA family hydrolase [Labedaea sp.]